MGAMGFFVLGLLVGLAFGALAVAALIRAVGRATGAVGTRAVLALAARALLPGARTDGVAAQRALARRVRGVSSRTASGGRIAATAIEVHASPEDHALLDASMGVAAAADDLTAFYRQRARQQGWRIIDDPVVTIVRDISLRPRQAYVRPTLARTTEEQSGGEHPAPVRRPAPWPPEPARARDARGDDATTDVLAPVADAPARAAHPAVHQTAYPTAHPTVRPDDAVTDVLPRAAPAATDTRSYPLDPTEVLGPGDLVVVHGTDVRTVPSSRGSASIGRAAHNDIVIDRPGVSRDHAVLERRLDGWWVVPGTSKNGTRLDGHLVDGPMRIDGQGELALGRGVRLRLSVEPADVRERA